MTTNEVMEIELCKDHADNFVFTQCDKSTMRG